MNISNITTGGDARGITVSTNGETIEVLPVSTIVTTEPVGTVQVEQNKVVLVGSGFSPYYSEDTKTWWEYDDEQKKYVNTGISPSAQDYAVLQNKPSINGIVLKSGQTNEDIDIKPITNFELLDLLK